MKTWNAQIISIFLPLIIAACGSSNHQVQTLGEAKALAAENNMKILVLVSTLGCRDCEQFKSEMKKNSRILKAIENVVFLDVDVATTAGKRLAEKHNIRTYPTYLLLNADETLISSWFGFFGAGDWAKTFNALLPKQSSAVDVAQNS
ncbi:MAG: thioredoxin family protein [Planctomycetota bacterium]|jgi:thioredoxin-related protein